MSYDKIILNDICLNISNKKILNKVSIHIAREKINVIYGKSGSGKTSLLNIINFLYHPNSGEMIYDDKTVNFNDNDFIDTLRKKEIAYFHQELALIENISLYENINIFANIKNQQIDSNQLSNYCKFLNIEPLIHTDISVMSGGERQRAAFIKLLLLNYSLVLIDEPTNNLDDENVAYIVNAIQMLKEKKTTIIIVSHSKEILKIADVACNMEEINEL